MNGGDIGNTGRPEAPLYIEGAFSTNLFVPALSGLDGV